jgi:hypothetical protein
MLVGDLANLGLLLLMIDCKRFVANTNKSRDKGSPYLTALLQWNTFARLPFLKKYQC